MVEGTGVTSCLIGDHKGDPDNNTGYNRHIMKKILSGILLSIIASIFIGCGGHPVSEAEFKAVWEVYLSREFEENFDEKQSLAQKEKILQDTVSKTGLDYADFVRFMKKNHPDKYSSIY
jgi:hypothetical protein